jgi:hypothetical protein
MSKTNIIRGLIAMGLLLVAIGIIVFVRSRPRPEAPLEPVHFTALGGPIVFGDDEMLALLNSVTTDANGNKLPPMIPTLIDKSSSVMLNYPTKENPDYSSIDVTWLGSRYYADKFRLLRGKELSIKGEKTIFTTKLMLYTWWAYLPEMIDHGYVKKVDNYYLMPADKFVELMDASLAHKTWADLGMVMGSITNDPINFASSEYGSSTGIEFMAYMANCFKPNDGSYKPCSLPVTEEEFPLVLPKLVQYVELQGGQGRSSIPSFGNFITDGQGNPFFVGFDSAYPSWAGVQGWSVDQIAMVSADPQNQATPNRLVGIYFEGAQPSEHVAFALTDVGVQVLNKLNNPAIQALAWNKLGMTTPQVFFFDAPISWMSTTVGVGNPPPATVYDLITGGLDALFKK